MPRLCRLATLTLLGLMLVPNALGQCPNAIATVRGQIDNLPSSATQVGVTVVLKTPKGDFPKSTAVSDGRFTVDVSFSTLKSYTFLWGHRCSNLPKSVILKVTSADKTLAEKVLDFKKNFQEQPLNRYQAKQDLTIDVSKSSTGKH